MIRRPPRSTLFPTRRSSDLIRVRNHQHGCDSLSERERMERGAEDRIWIGAERRSEIPDRIVELGYDKVFLDRREVSRQRTVFERRRSVRFLPFDSVEVTLEWSKRES